MIKYMDKHSNRTSKFNRVITDKDKSVNVNSEYNIFRDAFKDYLKSVHNISIKENTIQYIFLEILYKLSNNSDLDLTSTEIVDIIDYALNEDLQIDNYLDLSYIVDYNTVIMDIFNVIIDKYPNLVVTDYIAYHTSLYIILNTKIINNVVINKVLIKLPTELDSLLITHNVNILDVDTLMFINKLIDVAILIVRSSGAVNNEEGLILDLINSYKLYNKTGEYINLNSSNYETDISILKSSLYKLVENVMAHKLLIDSNKIVVETIINKNISILAEKDN